jgi:transcriptional regulator with XRE-family HTH domain
VRQLIYNLIMELSTMPAEKGFFAERLRELRTKAKLSQPELAEECGLAVGTIRQFEQGRREPTYETLVKLAEGLGVSLSAFDPPAKRRKKGE